MNTIRDLLNQAAFSDLTLLTSDKTLDREVKTIDVTETPDVAKYTLSHALILTTAMVFKDNQDNLLEFIDSLHKINVPGLCIKTSRFLLKIDEKVIQHANKLNFAIIEIPADKTLGILSHNMLDFVLGRQTKNVLFALDIQKHYSNLFIKGASPSVILNHLSDTISAPIILINPFLNEVASNNYFNKSKNPVGPYLKQISDQFENLSFKIQSISIIDYNGAQIQVNIYPIKASSSFPHYLVILYPNTLTYPIDQFAIDQAILVLSFILYKNMQIENSMIRIQSSFFSKLIFGKHPVDRKNPEFYEQGLNHGLISSKYYQVIVCKIVPTALTNRFDKEELSLIAYQWLIEKTVSSFKYALVFYRHNTHDTSILLQHFVDEIEDKLLNIASELYNLLGIKIHFGIGKSVDHPYEIVNSYFEGIKALDQENNDVIKHYMPSDLLTLFKAESKESVHYFVKKQLKSLYNSTDKSDIELLETLKCYLDNQSEITKTADELFLHRNTITFRIKKCEEILGADLKDPSTSLNLRLALYLLHSSEQ